MNANEARAITEAVYRSPSDASDSIRVLGEAIERLARRGQNYIEPWDCLKACRLAQPTEREKLAIQQHFALLGFTWHSHSFHPILAW